MNVLARRIALAVVLLGFGWGVFTHARDFLIYGFAPYRMAAPPLNAFWNALVALDAIAVALLLSRWRRVAIVWAISLMIADVGVNSYAAFGLALPGFPIGVAFQAAFLGFILGALPLLWPLPHHRQIAALGQTP